MSYNAWLYVYSNPTNFIDPSGRRPFCEGNYRAGEECVEEMENPPLTENGTRYYYEKRGQYRLTKYGGRSMYSTFQWYRLIPGWWNKSGCQEFTLEHFIGLAFMGEIGGQYEKASGILLEAFARGLWMDCPSDKCGPPYCRGSNCYNGALNYLGAEVESAQNRWTYYDQRIKPTETTASFSAFTHLSKKDTDYNDDSFLSTMYAIGKEILNPIRWKTCDTSSPYYWGNDKNLAKRVGAAGAKQGNCKKCIHYLSGDFLIYSIDQESNWSEE